jgi:Ca2+-binding EF-hand superfamily protein
MKATKLFAATALSLALAAPASAQIVLQSWDVDGDGELTGAEFRGLFNDNPTIAAIDGDGDGILTEAEYDAFFEQNVEFADTSFGSYGFASWDLDSDGLVQDTELQQGFLTIYDADGNGTIDKSEFTTVTGEIDM